MMKNFLVTGFTPFLDHKVNPTQQIVGSLNENHIETFVFDVSYKKVEKSLKDFQLNRYEKIILLGLSSSREFISVEEIAYNEIDVDKPDNEGKIIKKQPIVEKGESTLTSSLDLERIKNHFDAQISDDPGRYLCNYLYYLVLRENKNTVFIHLPKDIDVNKFTEEIKQLLF